MPGRAGRAGSIRRAGRCGQAGSGQGIDGPLLIGRDTHGLSEPAYATALEVLVANIDAPQERIESLFGRFPQLATAAADAAGFHRDDDLRTLVRQAVAQD